MVNTSSVKTNVPQQGLITDLPDSLVSEKVWTYARNATTNSHLGQIQFLQNEPSNTHCVDFPYTPIGFIKLLRNRWAVFSTDNKDSEIGIFDESTCEYSKLINVRCLNFSTNSLVEGESKESSDCTETIYWTDGRRNPRRYLNLSSIPYIYTTEDDSCKTKSYSNVLDCDALLINKKISVPNIIATNASGGSLKNGTYEFAVAYSVNKSRLTDFYGITLPNYIWSHENYGLAIDLQIDSLDREFDEYELIVISTIGGAISYKTIGWFSTATTFHHISSVDRTEYQPLSLEEVIIKRPQYPYADSVESNDQYILWSGVQTNPELNYQLQAMNIASNYVVYQVPTDYYRKGGTIKGYQRDETYAFGIQWLNETGEWSDTFHIPGKKGNGVELGVASGRDVYETTMRNSLGQPEVVRTWQSQNSSKAMRRTNSKGPEERIIAKGELGYWESSELYPDNRLLFGDNSCTPIRHHLMPDECKAPRYETGGAHIYILGMEFTNIEHPKDEKGQPIKGIVGYRIVRGNRRGNRRVMAKGIVTNVRAYSENNNEVLYTNYGFNDLRSDPFLSSKQTFNKAGDERDFEPLSAFKTNQFNFYSPETQFNHISLGNELAIYTEESGTVEGFFEYVYQHPKFKLLTELDLYFALLIGAIDGYLSTRGKKTYITPIKSNPLLPYKVQVKTGTTGAEITNTTVDNTVYRQATDDILNGINDPSITAAPAKFLVKALQTLAKVGMFSFFALEAAKNILDVIELASPPQQYALQYNSHGLFTSSRCVEKDFRRRYIQHYQYIFDGMNTVEGIQYNNFKREGSVYLRLNDSISTPSVVDDTRRTLSEFGLCNAIGQKVTSTASVMYVGIKRKMPDQYGQLDGISYLDAVGSIVRIDDSDTFVSPAIFGGDVFIGRMSTKRNHNFFANTITNVEDGFIYDYRTFRNVGYPRFWLDSTPYDISEFISIAPKLSNTPKNKHNLDCSSNDGITVVKNRHFYTSYNSAIEYFVESDINVDFRDWKGDEQNFYSSTNSNLSYLFRSDKLKNQEEFVYDNDTYSKQLTENYIVQQRLDFDPSIANECLEYNKNKIIYSMPAFKDQKGDAWLVYLAANQYTFSTSKFGELTGMHGVDNQQIMFLFSKSAPYITIGRDELQTNGGTKITIGDGGLFAREPRPITYTDHHYGSCQSKYSFMNTKFGSFYPSQNQGRIFSYRGQLEEITQSGMSYWFGNFLPSMLLKDFPEYLHNDNPIAGIGVTSVYDNTYEKYYISKKDYALLPEYKGKVRYDVTKDRFYFGSMIINLSDTNYFTDASWTISYDPASKIFLSWHDWHPDFYLPTEKNFMTLKGKSLWKHNDCTTSFCNFYGQDFPFQIEYLANSGQNVDVLRMIEYFLEVGKYFSEGRDFYMMLDTNFDSMIVHNNEQMSGELKLVLKNKRDVSQMFNYPRVDIANNRTEVLYDKEEQKYRINQLVDIVKDRGEFSGKTIPLWNTSPNGYIREINLKALNFNKPVQMKKKFRNVFQKVLLSRNVSGEYKFIAKFFNSKEVNSAR